MKQPPPMVYALAYIMYLYQNGAFAMTEPETETSDAPAIGPECDRPDRTEVLPGDPNYVEPDDGSSDE